MIKVATCIIGSIILLSITKKTTFYAPPSIDCLARRLPSKLNTLSDNSTSHT